MSMPSSGSSTTRNASNTCSSVGALTCLVLLVGSRDPSGIPERREGASVLLERRPFAQQPARLRDGTPRGVAGTDGEATGVVEERALAARIEHLVDQSERL